MPSLRVLRSDTGRPAIVAPSDLRYGIKTGKKTLAYALTYDHKAKADFVPYIRESYGSDFCVRVEVLDPVKPGGPTSLAKAFRGALQLLPGGREESRG